MLIPSTTPLPDNFTDDIDRLLFGELSGLMGFGIELRLSSGMRESRFLVGLSLIVQSGLSSSGSLIYGESWVFSDSTSQHSVEFFISTSSEFVKIAVSTTVEDTSTIFVSATISTEVAPWR